MQQITCEPSASYNSMSDCHIVFQLIAMQAVKLGPAHHAAAENYFVICNYSKDSFYKFSYGQHKIHVCELANAMLTSSIIDHFVLI